MIAGLRRAARPLEFSTKVAQRARLALRRIGCLYPDAALRRGKSKMKMTSLSQRVTQQQIPHRFDRLSLAVSCLLGAAAFAPSRAFAACSPAGGDNVTVTCSGATVDQGPAKNAAAVGAALRTVAERSRRSAHWAAPPVRLPCEVAIGSPCDNNAIVAVFVAGRPRLKTGRPS